MADALPAPFLFPALASPARLEAVLGSFRTPTHSACIEKGRSAFVGCLASPGVDQGRRPERHGPVMAAGVRRAARRRGPAACVRGERTYASAHRAGQRSLFPTDWAQRQRLLGGP